MNATLDAVCWASMPLSALPLLAELRNAPNVAVAIVEDRAWIRWPAGDDEVLRRVMPAPGVELYLRRDGLWYRPGHCLPTFGLPENVAGQPLLRALTPSPTLVAKVPELDLHPQTLRLLRDGTPRTTTALLCPLVSLTAWADTAASAELGGIRAAYTEGTVLLLGRRLPNLARSERLWGQRVLLPLGFRADPNLPESALREALGVVSNDRLVLTEAGAEIVPDNACQPLTRAAVRLALKERA